MTTKIRVTFTSEARMVITNGQDFFVYIISKVQFNNSKFVQQFLIYSVESLIEVT